MDFFDEVDEALRLQNEQIYTLGARQARVSRYGNIDNIGSPALGPYNMN